MKAIGYIVEANGQAMMLSNGILYFGAHGSLFRTRYRAQKAVHDTNRDRLKTYRRTFEQDFGEFTIRRIKEAA